MLRGPAPAASRPLVVERTIGPRTKGYGCATGGEGSQDARPAQIKLVACDAQPLHDHLGRGSREEAFRKSPGRAGPAVNAAHRPAVS